MKLRQVTAYSDKLLKGKRAKATLVCLMPVGVSLFFRLAEATLFSVMLYFGMLSPAGLFTAESPLHQLSAIVCTALRWLATAPLYYAAAYWFTQLCCEDKKYRRTPLSRIIINPRIYGRSLMALLLSKAAGLLFIIPAAFFGKTAVTLINENISNPSDSLQLFLSVHACVLTVLSFGLWIWSQLALLTVPFLLIKFPERSTLRIVKDSFSFMSGRRAFLLKIGARYLLPMLILPLTFPFMLAGLFSSSALFISICLKEDEYLERNKIYGCFGQARNTSKLSAWAKRCFTPSADKAQTAGYGDNP